MKWILILILYNPDSSILDVKEVLRVDSKEECVGRGKQLEHHYAQRGLRVKHTCVTPI